MCAGLDCLGGLEPFAGLDNLEALCFFVFVMDGLFRLEFSGLAADWERDAGLEGALEDEPDAGREEGSPEVADSFSSWASSGWLWLLPGRSWNEEGKKKKQNLN